MVLKLQKFYYKFYKSPLLKVQMLWEGQKNWKKSPILFWNYFVTSKRSGRFFHIFVAFSENLNFKIMGMTEILRSIWLFSTNKIKSSQSFSKQPTQLIVELNLSSRQKLGTILSLPFFVLRVKLFFPLTQYR